jgi:hypothetical protein
MHFHHSHTAWCRVIEGSLGVIRAFRVGSTESTERSITSDQKLFLSVPLRSNQSTLCVVAGTVKYGDRDSSHLRYPAEIIESVDRLVVF